MAIADEAVSVGKNIGSNFSVVGILPALAAVSWITLLVSMGAWDGPFDPSRAGSYLQESPLVLTAAILLVATLAGLVINPFQFTFTQWLEGYWGSSHTLSLVAARRINRYRARIREWRKVERDAEMEMIEKASVTEKLPAFATYTDQVRAARDVLIGASGDKLVPFDQRMASARRATRSFPSPSRVMPTRLGNSLRAFEDRAGRQYGLDGVVVAPHLMLISENPRSRYVSDTRRSMDLAIRMTLMALLTTPVSIGLLIDDGYWSLLSLVPYAVAYLSYRGAVAAASAYGNAVTFQIDLDRFALYEHLHMQMPSDTEQERLLNASLMKQLQGQKVQMHLAHEVKPKAAPLV